MIVAPRLTGHIPTCTRGGSRDYFLSLVGRAAAPATARHAARPVLAQWGLGEDAVCDALLVISELVTNAVVHALPPILLHLRPIVTEGRLIVHIEVTDGGLAPAPGRWVASCAADEHGRGRTVVAALAARSGTRTTRTGTAHWATLDT